ncbi:uncharacterized protein DUF4430 [Mobilisporobacter senegalensis]|uniref:Uncharacterized protein DUF4430 n=1 Tax=Mobilisporobacter senegalensis TaxID=1329262 RepID=A0A3N1XZA0_9FIRM|nr:DUF4430 domain-containing protein [Mobilisporobacter senegalensis]ROR31923.1 uncharacterized protein DUF4430 [Mobilisporobacter senegalensis]
MIPVKSNSNKKIWIGIVSLILAIGILFAIYTNFSPKGVAGNKNIVVEVVVPDQVSKEYRINTDEEYLRGALEQEKLIEGTESEYGLLVTVVDGIKADDSKQEWWCFTKDGGQLNTGVDSTPIQDGDHFEVTLTEGY